MNLTDWFPNSIKPMRNGVYETDCGMRHWHGGCWRIGADKTDSLAHPYFWRGMDREAELDDHTAEDSIPVPLTKEAALRAYARMMNTQDAGHIEPILADNFHYTSQWVLQELHTKQEFMDYITKKLALFKRDGTPIYAEVATVRIEGPCIVIAEETKDNLLSVVLAKVADGKLIRLMMCGVPSPHSASRTGDYPGLSEPQRKGVPTGEVHKGLPLVNLGYAYTPGRKTAMLSSSKK
jgi:hypothetical protein